MSESKDRADEIAAAKEQEAKRMALAEEYARRQKEADDRLKELSETFLSKEDAEKKFADSKLEAMKLTVIRRKWEAQAMALREQVLQVEKQIAAVDDRLTQLGLDDALTFRRTLNAAPSEPTMGEPVGGKK